MSWLPILLFALIVDGTWAEPIDLCLFVRSLLRVTFELDDLFKSVLALSDDFLINVFQI